MIQNLRTMESLLIPLIASRLVVGTFLCCFGLRLFPLLSFLIGGGGTFLLSCSLFNHYFSEPHSGSTFLIAGILSISGSKSFFFLRCCQLVFHSSPFNFSWFCFCSLSTIPSFPWWIPRWLVVKFTCPHLLWMDPNHC